MMQGSNNNNDNNNTDNNGKNILNEKNGLENDPSNFTIYKLKDCDTEVS